MILSDKHTVRRAVRAEIAKLSAEERSALSSQIFSKIASLEQIKQASVVALFVALPDEPQTADFIEQLSLQNKRVVTPRIEGEVMNFYDISEGVEVGAFGIMEPLATTPIDPAEIDVMVVPGVAFTRHGARLGRGKGFYDKYLSLSDFRAYTIGVCYPCQIVEELPSEEHDKMLDTIVSI
jgi:5-formyltetrahydrofolate cyclo-ligase